MWRARAAANTRGENCRIFVSSAHNHFTEQLHRWHRMSQLSMWCGTRTLRGARHLPLQLHRCILHAQHDGARATSEDSCLHFQHTQSSLNLHKRTGFRRGAADVTRKLWGSAAGLSPTTFFGASTPRCWVVTGREFYRFVTIGTENCLWARGRRHLEVFSRDGRGSARPSGPFGGS